MDLNYLLAIEPESEENLVEDLLIIQPDGTRACLNWELRGKGYHIDNLKETKQLSDEELLKSAKRDLNKYLKNKNRQNF